MGLKKHQHHEGKTQFLSSNSNKSHSQPNIYRRLLITELEGFWIKVHSDPGIMGSSLPLLRHHDLSFACAVDYIRFLSLPYCNRNKKTTEFWESKDQKRARKNKKTQRFGKMPKASECCLLKPREMIRLSIRALHDYGRSDQNCRFRYEVATSNTVSHKSDDNLIGVGSRCDKHLRLCHPVEQCTPLQDKTRSGNKQPESRSKNALLYLLPSLSEFSGTYSPRERVPNLLQKEGSRGSILVVSF